MTVSQMRSAISNVYSGKGWKEKVSNMPECQVIAVYYKFLNEGKFNKKSEPQEKKPLLKWNYPPESKPLARKVGDKMILTEYGAEQLKLDIPD